MKTIGTFLKLFYFWIDKPEAFRSEVSKRPGLNDTAMDLAMKGFALIGVFVFISLLVFAFGRADDSDWEAVRNLHQNASQMTEADY